MMNCEQCKNNMIEYVEGSLSESLDMEMEQHLLQCEGCKKCYEREVLVDKAFNDAFIVDGVKFKSSKDIIMNSIDREKYTKGKNKFLKSKNNYKKSAVVAAVFFFLGVLTPMAYNYFGDSGSNSNRNTVMEAQDSAGSLVQDQSQMKATNESFKMEAPMTATEREVVDNYENSVVPIDTKIDFHSTWKLSPNKTMEATIVGKGNNAVEEGIGTIYIKNNDNNIMYKFDIKNYNTQKSPLDVNWYDNNRLIVVNGLGYGTLINGEEAQLMNPISGEEYLIYRIQNAKERIKSVVRKENQLIITKAIYGDAMNSYVEQVDTENITD